MQAHSRERIVDEPVVVRVAHDPRRVATERIALEQIPARVLEVEAIHPTRPQGVPNEHIAVGEQQVEILPVVVGAGIADEPILVAPRADVNALVGAAVHAIVLEHVIV